MGLPAAPVLLIALAAFALRLVHVGTKGFWADEIFTALFASPGNDVSTVVAESLATPLPTPPLGFLISHAFASAFGDSEFVFRLPSVIAGTLGVIMIYKVGQLLFSRRVGLIAAILLTISPYHLLVAREGRFYAAIVLFALLSLYCLQKGMDTGKRRWWAGFVIAALINNYIHLTAFLVLAVELTYAAAILLWQLWSTRRDERPLTWSATYGPALLISVGLIFVGYLPMAPYLFSGMLHDSRGIGGSSPQATWPVSAGEFGLLLKNFSAGSGINLLFYLGAAFLGMIELVRHKKQTALLMALWFLLPFVLIFIMRPKHWFNTKYVIAMLPIYLLLTAAGISQGVHLAARGWSRLRCRLTWTAAVPLSADKWPLRLSMSALLLPAVLLFYGTLNAASPRLATIYRQSPGGWKELGQIIGSNAESADVVVSPPLVMLTMPAPRLMSYYGPESAEELQSLDQLEELLATHHRVWIVRRPASQERPGLERYLPALDEIWQNLPPHVELSLGAGVRILYLGEHKTRLTLLDEVQRFDNLPARALASIARTYRTLNLPNDALRIAHQATEMEPDSASWRFLEGTIYEQKGNLPAAQTSYETAGRLGSTNPSFLFSLGLAFERLGDQEQAIEHYERALHYHDRVPAEEETQELYYALNRKLTSLRAEAD
jgi:4-amino-4-deoxy-L-arabinose transferase-like glycosyltransferase